MKEYTTKDAAKLLGVQTSTIRFYDKEGLLPFMQRRESGYRVFHENDLALLRTIDCLKRTGMPIKDIRRFTDLLLERDASLQARYEMFLERREAVKEQIAELENTLEFIEKKCRYYETAIEAGTESIHYRELQEGILPCEA